jgi:hypothetical protein
MLAVVGQEVVTVFTEPGMRAANDLQGVIGARRVRSDPNDFFVAETLQGHFLYRVPDEAQRLRAVVDNTTFTHVNAVVEIATSRRYEMRS